MTTPPSRQIRDEQVFLIMGVHPDDEDAQCAIVLAPDLHEAQAAFARTYRGAQAMTWPSLTEIKQCVTMMEAARQGGLPDDIMVINALRQRGGQA